MKTLKKRHKSFSGLWKNQRLAKILGSIIKKNSCMFVRTVSFVVLSYSHPHFRPTMGLKTRRLTTMVAAKTSRRKYGFGVWRASESPTPSKLSLLHLSALRKALFTGLVIISPGSQIPQWEKSYTRAFVKNSKWQLLNLTVVWRSDTSWEIRGWPKNLKRRFEKELFLGVLKRRSPYSYRSSRPFTCESLACPRKAWRAQSLSYGLLWGLTQAGSDSWGGVVNFQNIEGMSQLREREPFGKV